MSQPTLPTDLHLRVRRLLLPRATGDVQLILEAGLEAADRPYRLAVPMSRADAANPAVAALALRMLFADLAEHLVTAGWPVGEEVHCRRCGCTQEAACVVDGLPCAWIPPIEEGCSERLCTACERARRAEAGDPAEAPGHDEVLREALGLTVEDAQARFALVREGARAEGPPVARIAP